jgi:peroxiredoxin
MKRLIILCFLILPFTNQAQNTGYKPGDIVKDFKLKNINNKIVSLEQYQSAKGFIIALTCNTCPYAKAYEQRIIELNEKFAGKGYPVIAINTNDPAASPGDSFEKMKERAETKNFPFPYLLDPEQVVTKQFGAARTPTLFVAKKTPKGNVVEYIGAIDDDTENSNPQKTPFVENVIEALMKNKKPEIVTTKAVGCTIKWKKS